MTDMNPGQMPPSEPFGLGQPMDTPTSDDKLWGGLSYISQFIVPAVLPVILLLVEDMKKRPFIRLHAVQSLGLLVAAIVFELAATVLVAISTAIFPLLACITWIVFLLPIVPFIYYGVLAFQGKTVDIPYLSDFMRRQGWL